MLKAATADALGLTLRYISLLFNRCQRIEQLNKTVHVILQIMDEMFGHKSWMNPILTLDSANNIPSSNSLACSSSDTTSLSPKSPSSSASSNSGRRRKRK